MRLEKDEFTIISLLQSDPSLSYSAIASTMGLSVNTVKRKILVLKEKKIYSGSYALYDPNSLGLVRFFVFIRLAKYENYPIVEQAIKEHPYSIYRSRFYGPSLGVFCQFDYPESKAIFIQKFLLELQQKEIIEDYEIFKSTGVGENLGLKLSERFKDLYNWDYDWDLFYEEFSEENCQLPKPKKNVVLSLKELDMKILRQLTSDATISQKEMCDNFNADRWEISRRIQFLTKHVITKLALKIDQKVFNFTSNKIVILEFSNDQLLAAMYNQLRNYQVRPPFRYSIEIVENNIGKKHLMVYITLQQYHEAQMIYTLCQKAKYRLFDIDVTGKNATRYSFYEKNYNFDNKCWNLSEEYVVTEPIISTLKQF